LVAGAAAQEDALVPELAGVPLETGITGLTKRYHDGQLAVDGVSLRVARPGRYSAARAQRPAGKTTTLADPDGH